MCWGSRCRVQGHGGEGLVIFALGFSPWPQTPSGLELQVHRISGWARSSPCFRCTACWASGGYGTAFRRGSAEARQSRHLFGNRRCQDGAERHRVCARFFPEQFQSFHCLCDEKLFSAGVAQMKVQQDLLYHIAVVIAIAVKPFLCSRAYGVGLYA